MFNPMLASKVLTLGSPKGSYEGRIEEVTLPKIGTPKIDGIRGLKQDGRLLSRKLLPIPNDHVRTICEAVVPDGFDGEIWIPGKTYNEVQSEVMSTGGRPDFRFMVFDVMMPIRRYDQRIKLLEARCDADEELFFGTVEYVQPTLITSLDELIAYNDLNLSLGWEGSCFRDPDSPYKQGRSTFTEQYLLKLKTYLDDEALIIGFEELNHNDNEIGHDELGYIKRSKSASGLRAGGKLGNLIVYHPTFGCFKVGSGFTEALRTEIWNNQPKYLNQPITFRYQPYGLKLVPRCPIFKGFRLD